MGFRSKVSSKETQARVYWAASSLLRLKENSPEATIDELRMHRLMKDLSGSEWERVAKLANEVLKIKADDEHTKNPGD